MSEMIDMCDSIKISELPFVLNPNDAWESFDTLKFESIMNGSWFEEKFLNNTTGELNNNLKSIPNDKGGIYVFIAKPNVIPDIHMYILYIGRALSTPSQNLRKRLRNYIKDSRPRIEMMRSKWGKYLYIRYLPLTDNEIIEALEEELTRVIHPPCNIEYPGVIRGARTAAFV